MPHLESWRELRHALGLTENMTMRVDLEMRCPVCYGPVTDTGLNHVSPTTLALSLTCTNEDCGVTATVRMSPKALRIKEEADNEP